MFGSASVRENRCTLFFVLWVLATFACAKYYNARTKRIEGKKTHNKATFLRLLL